MAGKQGRSLCADCYSSRGLYHQTVFLAQPDDFLDLRYPGLNGLHRCSLTFSSDYAIRLSKKSSFTTEAPVLCIYLMFLTQEILYAVKTAKSKAEGEKCNSVLSSKTKAIVLLQSIYFLFVYCT